MEIRIYDTLIGEKTYFKSIINGEVGMYTCGPTVYNYAHIGNLRAYVFSDILRRTLEWNGYKVKQVINITDVGQLTGDDDEGEDKMTKAVKREGLPMTLESMEKIAGKYTDAFVSDLKSLNIEMPTELPRASKHIVEDIEIIKKLENKGYAYKISDGIYFDTSKFKDYGKLGGVNKAQLREGARVSVNIEKKHPQDFTLWKFNTGLGWDTPWGKGFPGWHIECSAMSRKYLGQPFDIHTGGIDHIGTHHNNEIAQSESAYGTPLAKYWMHSEFLTVKSSKMAKSEDNFIKLSDLEKQSISPLSYRYWLLTGHYRSPIDFTLEAVKAGQNAYQKLTGTISRYPEGGHIIEEYRHEFTDKINDDLNMPEVIALLWKILKDNQITETDKRATILEFDKVLGLNLNEQEAVKPLETSKIPDDVKNILKERERAKEDKDWKKSDQMRDELRVRGYKIVDTKDNTQEVYLL